MNNDIKYEVIDLLKQRGTYSVSASGIQHYTRCPFCGDSTNPNHAHLSIKINVDTDDPMVFRCLKCNVSGLVSDTLFEELGILMSNDSLKELKAYTRKSMRLAKLVNMDCEKIIVPLHTQSRLSDMKLQYLNDRLGLNFDYPQAQEHKIILDVYEFMKANDILDPNRKVFLQSDWMINLLNENYIGFLSANNNCITFRDVTGTGKWRYYKAVINEKNVNMDSFYTFPGRFDLMYTDRVDVHIAEGIFDILSIKNNLIKDTDKNFYYASCGFGSVSIMKYILHHAMNTGVHLHIYSDNDKRDLDHIRYLKNKDYTEWMDQIYIHRNLYPYEKDYGIPLSRIQDSSRILQI